MGEESVIDQISSLLEEESAQLNLYRSKPTYLEVITSGTDKARGLQQLFDHSHQELEAGHVAAFGDNYNDIELLSYAGWGVAVGNAREKVKSVANRISVGNKEHGVAIELERLIAEGKLMLQSSSS
jgi:hydroxymethylpyrimidine pyrophosphatase-like HAD family hydrolase